MSAMTDAVGGYSRLRPLTPRSLAEDMSALSRGILDVRSLLSGYRKAHNPVTVTVRDSHGRVKAIRRTHNLKTTNGIDGIAAQLGGDVVANTSTGTATGTSATSLTNSGASWTTNQFANHIVQAGTSWSVVKSNTATVLTTDQWYLVGSSTGASTTTPGATSTYIIMPGNAPGMWIAMSNDAVAPAAGDTTLATELSTNGFSRAFATYAHTGGAATLTWSHTFTSSGTQAVQKAGIFNAASGGLMIFENTFTSASTVSGDTVAVTWQVTIS